MSHPNPLNASVAAVPMPDRIKALPVSEKGFPVPWFVDWSTGVPDFRVIGNGKIVTAHNKKLCWVCGQKLGRSFAITMGPMCAISRTIAEPPSHRECAIFAAKACPFLANPAMRRREKDLPENRTEAAGMIKRNPGAVAVWVTRGYRPFRAGDGVLFTFDDPIEVLWFAEGREATREEVVTSIETGFPLLQAEAAKQGAEAVHDLTDRAADVMKYLPGKPDQEPTRFAQVEAKQ